MFLKYFFGLFLFFLSFSFNGYSTDCQLEINQLDFDTQGIPSYKLNLKKVDSTGNLKSVYSTSDLTDIQNKLAEFQKNGFCKTVSQFENECHVLLLEKRVLDSAPQDPYPFKYSLRLNSTVEQDRSLGTKYTASLSEIEAAALKIQNLGFCQKTIVKNSDYDCSLLTRYETNDATVEPKYLQFKIKVGESKWDFRNIQHTDKMLDLLDQNGLCKKSEFISQEKCMVSWETGSNGFGTPEYFMGKIKIGANEDFFAGFDKHLVYPENNINLLSPLRLLRFAKAYDQFGYCSGIEVDPALSLNVKFVVPHNKHSLRLAFENIKKTGYFTYEEILLKDLLEIKNKFNISVVPDVPFKEVHPVCKIDIDGSGNLTVNKNMLFYNAGSVADALSAVPLIEELFDKKVQCEIF